MTPDILLVRRADGYRVLHGHLHLSNAMRDAHEAVAYASGEGRVELVRIGSSIFVKEEQRRIPLLWVH